MLLDVGSVLGGIGLAVVAFVVVILVCVVILRLLAAILPSYEDRDAPPVARTRRILRGGRAVEPRPSATERRGTRGVSVGTCAPTPGPVNIHKRSFMKDSFMGSDAPSRPPRRALPGSIAAGASDLSVHFEGLANPTRLLIVERLAATSEMRVSELADFCQVSQPRMSWHLRILRKAEVIRTRREGREVFCRLDREAIATHFKSFARLISSAGVPAEITSTTPIHEGAS